MIAVTEEIAARLKAKREGYWASKGQPPASVINMTVCRTCGSNAGPFRWAGEGKSRRMIHVGCTGQRKRS